MLPRARARVVALLAVVIASGIAAALPAGASAGEYHTYWCETPSGRQVPTELGLGADTGGILTEDTCGQPGGRVALDLGSGARTANGSAYAEVRAPWGTTIVKVRMQRTLRVRGGDGLDSAGTTSAFAVTTPWTWPSQRLSTCAYSQGCTDASGVDEFEVPRTPWLRFAVGCLGTSGGWCAGGSTSRARAELSALDFTVDDNVLPEGGVLSGTALDAGAHRGVDVARFKTVDPGGGVLRVYATLDGTEVGSVGPGGACTDRGEHAQRHSYDKIAPCPESYDSNLSIDTRLVGDGERLLRVIVEDVGGNRVAIDERRVVVDNIPLPVAQAAPAVRSSAALDALRPGDVLHAVSGSWAGVGIAVNARWQRFRDADGWTDVPGAGASSYVVGKADVGYQLRLVERATNSKGSVDAASPATGVVSSGATVQVASTGPQAVESASAPQLVLDREQRAVQVGYGSKIVVTGRLVDSGGAPIADAEVDVFEQVSVVGSAWKKVATVRTDSQGGYAYRPTTTGSRVVRFAYAAKRDSGDYRATREVVIAVTAGMEIRARRKVISPRGLISLRGRVRAEPLPAKGTWVEIQVLDAGVWRTVATRRTSRTGRWSFKHRVRSVSHVRFAFRARLRQVADVPAAESKSSVVKVRVR